MAENLTLTSKLKGMGKEFFLQTSADPADGKGRCVLFEGANPIDITEFRLTGQGKPPAVVVEEFHRARLERFHRLSELYEELADENDPSILEKLGVSLADQSLFREAIKIFEKAKELAAHNSSLYDYLGLLYLEVNEPEKARENFQKAIQLNPDYPDYHHNHGRALLKLGRCVQAFRSCEKAIELNVYFGEAYYTMAMALVLNGLRKEDYALAQGLEDRAVALLAKAVGFNPHLKNEHLQQGIDALGAKDLAGAYAALERGYESARPGFPSKFYHFHLDYLYRGDQLSEEAVIRHIRKLQKQIEENPNFPDLYNELGMAYTVLTQFHSDRAIEAYQKALRLNPNYKAALKNLKLTQNELKGLKTLLRALLK